MEGNKVTDCQIVLPSGAVRVFSWGAGKWNETKAAGLSEPVHIRQLPLFNVHCLSLFPAGSLLWQSLPFQSHPSGMVLLLSIQAAPIPRACTVQENQVCCHHCWDVALPFAQGSVLQMFSVYAPKKFCAVSPFVPGQIISVAPSEPSREGLPALTGGFSWGTVENQSAFRYFGEYRIFLLCLLSEFFSSVL